ncbi:MAG: hypothetical protein II625_02200 [Bacilli bacterium]|nr:hypothetical protein [Bacilli bacterium]
MKNKILIALVVVLLIINIALIVALCKTKKEVNNLNDKIDKISATVDNQNELIARVHNDVETLKMMNEEGR